MSEQTEQTKSYNINDVMKMLPHRYPFLLVDKAIDVVAGERGIGFKNVTVNEPFFQGHFPGNPVMPGVLQIEAMAQCSAPIILCLPEYKNKFALFAGIESAKFKNIVRPGTAQYMSNTQYFDF